MTRTVISNHLYKCSSGGLCRLELHHLELKLIKLSLCLFNRLLGMIEGIYPKWREQQELLLLILYCRQHRIEVNKGRYIWLCLDINRAYQQTSLVVVSPSGGLLNPAPWPQAHRGYC